MALERLSAEEFVRRLKAYIEGEHSEARFAFFLGAGCSVSSGIPTGHNLVRDHWLPRLRSLSQPERSDLDAWVSEEFAGTDGKLPDPLYGDVMRRLFPLPSLRQAEVEFWCAGRRPRFGYATLATLMATSDGRFSVVLTTNFDDLVADALYLFTGARPLVIHHAALGPFIRPARTRPLIVKLHGDHQLAPLNTTEETAKLDEQLGGPVRSLLHDRGLIFLGYGGNDRGIAAMLSELPTEALPFGVFWVSGSEPQGVIRSFLEERGAWWIEHRGFDELMVLVRDAFALPAPDRRRIEETFAGVEQDYVNLSQRIRVSSDAGPDTDALKLAVSRIDASLSDWGAVELAAQRYKQSDPDRAKAIYEEGIKRLPDSVPLLGNFANLLKDIGEDDYAEELYSRALESDPNYAIVLGDYAVFLWRHRRNPERAEEYFRRSLEADQTYALGNYANFLSEVRGNQHEAERLYQLAISADPNNPAILGNYAAYLARERKQYHRAGELYQHALRLSPDNADNLSRFASLVADHLGNAEAAELLFGRALAVASNNPDILGNYANFLAHTVKDYERAEATFRLALTRKPDHVRNLTNFATFLWQIKGNVDEASHLFEEAYKIDPNDFVSLLLFADFLSRAKAELERPEELYRRALEINPSSSITHLNLGAFLAKDRGNLAEAESHYREAIEADANDANTWTNLAGVLLAQGKTDEGLRALRSALDLVDDATATSVECWFYQYAHGEPELRQEALSQIKRLLLAGVRSPSWSLDHNVDRARQVGHPDSEWIAKLASIITEGAELSILNGWGAWEDVDPRPDPPPTAE